MIDRIWKRIEGILEQWQLFFALYFLLLILSYTVILWLSNSVPYNTLTILVATPWILFALFAAFGDASVGFIDEWLLHRLQKDSGEVNIDAPGRLLLISGFFGGVVALGAYSYAIVTGTELLFSNTTVLLFGLGAGILEIIWMIPYFHALEKGGAITSTPLFQTIPIFSLLIGILFFGEFPLLIHVIAALFIIVGGAILNYTPSSQRINIKPLAMMLFASAVVSIGYFSFKEASEAGNFLSAVILNGLGMTLFSSIIWIGYAPYRAQFNSFIRYFDARILGAQFLNEGLYALSTMAAQFAIVIGPSVMVVTAFNAFNPIFTLCIGWTLALLGSHTHAETLSGTRKVSTLVGVVCIAIGTAMIAV